MALGLSAAFAVGPSLLLLWYLYSRDANPEPRRVIWTTFCLGCLIAIPVLIVGRPLKEFGVGLADPYRASLFAAFAVAAVPEELFKFLVVVRYSSRHQAFDEPMDGLVYGAVASLGFATLENILFVMDGGLGVAILRSISAVPAHAAMGAIMGYYVGQARFDPNHRVLNLCKALCFPILLHGRYDFPLMALGEVLAEAGDTAGADGLLDLGFVGAALGVLVFILGWSRLLVRRLQRSQGQSP